VERMIATKQTRNGRMFKEKSTTVESTRKVNRAVRKAAFILFAYFADAAVHRTKKTLVVSGVKSVLTRCFLNSDHRITKAKEKEA
jgi:hypothetical protein